MKRIERLRLAALKSCKIHGHKMQPFDRKYRYWWSSSCKVCSASVNLNAELLPNTIPFSGPAVTLHCAVVGHALLG
ncbi:hypothetical protein LCGC14_1721070 [marine sediment metagenome]|uniref:Uncharacterized protein n=1 Tax=marine sediment metagenome TaxID=412755 RepID=A0A0F9JSU3_9ZZZZ